MSTPAIDHNDALQPGTPPDSRPGLLPRLAAEAFGSLFIVVAGLGVPLFTIPDSSPLPAALAAGLAVTAAMLAFAHVSGGHFNPAITVGHLLAGRIRAGAAAAYAAAQVAGGFAGALALFAVLRTLPGITDSRTAFDTVTAGFGEHSIIQAPLAAALLLEMLGAAIIVAVFLGTSGRAGTRGRDGAPSSGASVSHGLAAPVAVGLSFAVLLQLGQSVGNLPFNPARAVSSAVFSSGWALEQLWVFLAAPLVGAAVAGLVFRSFGPGVDAVRGNTGPAAAPESNRSGGTDTSPEAAGATGHVHQGGDGSGRAGSEAQEFFEGKRG
ncbi:aquaporin [Pseudarthrobacter sp. NamB4]|uniref:aquaporin n=1 Tax=Pseudarthrobacter sp. NamB4 TaxID=2576837 RepID=UPI0010FF234B|nr:aquaporin [Pseudarthrobacter sp. NamB4]TLM72501.1 porin [Pseudarthrobacter sp. NamB4]